MILAPQITDTGVGSMYSGGPTGSGYQSGPALPPTTYVRPPNVYTVPAGAGTGTTSGGVTTTPTGGTVVNTGTQDQAITSLVGLLSSQFAGAGGYNQPVGALPIDPALMAGGLGQTPVTTSSSGSKLGIIVLVLVVLIVGYWFTHRRAAA